MIALAVAFGLFLLVVLTAAAVVGGNALARIADVVERESSDDDEGPESETLTVPETSGRPAAPELAPALAPRPCACAACLAAALTHHVTANAPPAQGFGVVRRGQC